MEIRDGRAVWRHLVRKVTIKTRFCAIVKTSFSRFQCASKTFWGRVKVWNGCNLLIDSPDHILNHMTLEGSIEMAERGRLPKTSSSKFSPTER